MLILLDNLSLTKNLQQCCSPKIYWVSQHSFCYFVEGSYKFENQRLPHAAQGTDQLFKALTSVYVQIKCKDPLPEPCIMGLQGTSKQLYSDFTSVSLLWVLWATQVVQSNQGALCSGCKGLPLPCTPDAILAPWGLCNRPAGSPFSPSSFTPWG